MSSSENRPVHVFLSYHHDDSDVLNEPRNHLASLEMSKEITVFDDRNMTAGDDSHMIIQQELDRADIIIAIVSGAFMGSNYCAYKELWEARRVRVLPFIAEDYDLKSTVFEKFLALPLDEQITKPLNKWGRNRDVALKQVAEHLRKIAETVRAEKLPNHLTGAQTDLVGLRAPAQDAAIISASACPVGKSRLVTDLVEYEQNLEGLHSVYIASDNPSRPVGKMRQMMRCNIRDKGVRYLFFVPRLNGKTAGPLTQILGDYSAFRTEVMEGVLHPEAGEMELWEYVNEPEGQPHLIFYKISNRPKEKEVLLRLGKHLGNAHLLVRCPQIVEQLWDAAIKTTKPVRRVVPEPKQIEPTSQYETVQRLEDTF